MFHSTKLFKLFFGLCFLVFFLSSFHADQGRLSVHLESKRLHKGQVITTIADMYFKNSDGSLVVHYIKPNDYVFITNAVGEAKVYYPDKNEVIVSQNDLFSSENDVLYTFLSNRHSDMGLKEGGFTLTSSRKDEKNYLVTTWVPQAPQKSLVSKIELVHEGFFPIYMSYYGSNGKVYKKTYFSSYYTKGASPFPTQIIEIDYLPKNDSIVSRKRYSDIRINGEANSSYFGYTVPSNAKLIKLQPKAKNK
ncbi:MAG TPA: hypothetical protein VHO90_10680 [Bacteroidales bacterium]|nr:hypothetical protein [Bacteroidales bacterium]